MIAFIRRRPLSAFFGPAYAISWSWWIPLALNGAVVRQGSASPTQFPGLLGPALAAIIVTAATAWHPAFVRCGDRADASARPPHAPGPSR